MARAVTMRFGDPVSRALLVWLVLCRAVPAAAQVDQRRAESYFAESRTLCEGEAGRLWGVSLCGPMVFADAATRTVATSHAAPEAPPPPALGFANATLEWGGIRWSSYVWRTIPGDAHRRARLLLHELFHRVQPGLGLVTPEADNAHLDTFEGRYWLQLEWRALARALGATGPAREAAVRDALAFRSRRRALFTGSAENERREEIREGLAQYTATVVAAASPADARADAVEQLTQAPRNETLVRTFAYASGAAYGLLLDAWFPGWTRRVRAGDDLGELLMASAGLRPSDDPERAAARYDGLALWASEQSRDSAQRALVLELRRRFVDGPVLVLPGAPGSFASAGLTPIPGAGTVFPDVRVTAEWGRLVADRALRSTDRSTISLPAPRMREGATISGDGWTLEMAPGWTLRPGPRPGDVRPVREGS